MRATTGLLLAGGLLSLLPAGCAARDTARLRGELEALKRRLAVVDQARQKQAERADELESRVLILRDKLETAQLAAQRTARRPRLPVVRLGRAPAGKSPPSPGPAAAPAPDGGAADEVVEPAIPAAVAGLTEREAARQGGGRPVLRVVGRPLARPRSARRPGSARVAPSRAPVDDVPRVDERLPIAPLPDELDASGSRPERADGEGRAAPGTLTAVRLYRTALAAMRARRFDEALGQFAAFVARYPRHDYADNALYWRGECFYARKDFARAIPEFERVIREYPYANKAPDALLKLGFAYLSLGKRPEGRVVLKQVMDIYPRNRVARLARAKLEGLAPEGKSR